MEFFDFMYLSDEQIFNQINYIFSDDVDLEGLYSYFRLYTRMWTDINELRNNFRKVISEYPPLDSEYEEACVYRPYISPEEVFEPVNKLVRTRKNMFLFNENNSGMR